jgi:hypothetical protein
MNRSSYAGLAAVFVLGTGLLIVGYSLPSVRQDRAGSMLRMGFLVLGLGSFVLLLVVAPDPSYKALIVSAGAAIVAACFAWHAGSNEFTGNATYYELATRNKIRGERVTHQTSPIKFRAATNGLWAASAVSVTIAIVSFLFYRKPNESDEYM